MAESATREAQQSNVSPTTFLEFYREASKAKQGIDDANSVYRTVLKRAKAAGINTGALTESIRVRRQDEDKRETHLRDLKRYMAWLGVPDTSEYAPREEAPKPSQRAQAEQAAWDAEDSGNAAGRRGDSRTANPHPLGSALFEKWDAGWRAGQKAIVDTMGKEATKKGAAEKAPKGKKGAGKERAEA